ncbi:HAD family hydrolase [uncultured Winogradskyella sp.]|uniref:NIF family HAD-type phosphatase n=1 Tax=uncultured Winogradskyella sp. TaxID=395353 RepID=UPI00263564C9|nr:HAD family hydrolase [uncultured Winogradskyella sp.]
MEIDQKKESKILLVLDIDETLVHATPERLSRKADFKVFDYFVYLRPYLNDFLTDIKDDFLVSVWSSASDDYVEEVVKKIFPKDFDLKFVWGRSRCTPKRFLHIDDYDNSESRYLDHFNYIKPLKKVKKRGYNMDKILIVDDTPHKSSDNYGNAIYPKEYLGDTDDDELKELSKYLKTLKNIGNVRKIEKRGWRNKIE